MLRKNPYIYYIIYTVKGIDTKPPKIDDRPWVVNEFHAFPEVLINADFFEEFSRSDYKIWV